MIWQLLSQRLADMVDAMAYHRLTYLLVAIGGFVLGCSLGILNPFAMTLIVVSVFAFAAARAPSQRSLFLVSSAMSAGPVFMSIFMFMAASSGGRSQHDPDPTNDLFTGLSMACAAGAIWLHFLQVRKNNLATGRWMYLCAGLIFVFASIPDLLSQGRQAIGFRQLLIGLVPLVFAAVPSRFTAALLLVGFAFGLVGSAHRFWTVISNPESIVLAPISVLVISSIGFLLLYCAVGVQLLKAYIDASSAASAARNAV